MPNQHNESPRPSDEDSAKRPFNPDRGEGERSAPDGRNDEHLHDNQKTGVENANSPSVTSDDGMTDEHNSQPARPLEESSPRRSEEKGSTSGNENYGATKQDGLKDSAGDPKR